MSDNKKTRRFVTPNDEVKEMLSGKFDGLLEQTVVKPETEASQKLQQMEKTSAQKIKESLTNKIETLLVLQEKTFTGKYAASKYLGKSISDIMTEERRVNNYIQEIEERLNSLTEEFLAPYRKAGNKTFGWNEERVEIYVEDMKQRNLIRSGATDPKEIEARKKYMELKEELAQAKAEKNAIEVAKTDYMEQNADLIREAQERNRVKDLEKSGLLEEMELAEPDPVKTEEEPKEAEEKTTESEEQTDESNISE